MGSRTWKDVLRHHLGGKMNPERQKKIKALVDSGVNIRKAYRMTQPPKVEHENEEAYIVKKGKWV